MRRVAVLAVVSLLVVAGAAPAAAAATPAATEPVATGDAADSPVASTGVAANNTTVTLLTYNDIQTAVVQNGTTPRMVSLIDQRRAAHDNPTVLIGGGDQVSPHSLSPISQWRTPVDVLNVLEPDAEVIGNHDLDYGFEPVSEFSNASEFPWLMANIVQEDSGEPIPGTEPYTVIERDGVRVGVIGVADEKIKSKTAVDFDEQGYELRDHVETSSEYATQLKEEENVDVVVVSAHLGVPVAKEIANGTENVDAIVVGDDEIEYPPQETGGSVIVEAEARAQHVGEVNLTVSDGEVVDWNGSLLDVTENVSYDEETAQLIESARADQLSTVLGETDVALDAQFSSNYHDETNYGNLITDAFRWKTDSQVAITNAGGIRSDGVYGPGNLTAGDVYSVLPFGNTLVEVELTGAEIKQLLASQVITLESETGQQYGAEAQLQVSGVTYEWVGHENASPQIRDVRINGEPLEEDETYTVTVNSYMKGWDGSVLENATVVEETKTLYGTAVAEYVQTQGTVAPEGNDRIRRLDRELDTAEATLDGEGEVTVSYDLPEAVESVNESTVRATTAANATVAPTDVSVADGTLELTFADGDLQSLSEYGGDVQVYAAYEDAEYNRSYFDASVLNVEINTTVDDGNDGSDGSDESDESDGGSEDSGSDDGDDSDESDDSSGGSDETTTEEASTDQPGFGPVVAIAALVLSLVGLSARRRD
ncbi:5'-nucleotidase C-terminal domain-containing protein [Halostella litorea]|uniref:5'-nucleotidase C-terminal domain-containing protein n=1 Tax=Halostella litorea TaxID=2528831 RepID=UPI001092D299|nr:5'-nucleotidase C-terminal domain-containing protein [Halostella litorea]